MATSDFNGYNILSENDEKQTLRYDLQGFRPNKPHEHAYSARVTDGMLITEVRMGNETYQDIVDNCGLNSGAVKAKAADNHVDVVIKKPDPSYSIINMMKR